MIILVLGLAIVVAPWAISTRGAAGAILLDCCVYWRHPRSWRVLWTVALVVIGIGVAGSLVTDFRPGTDGRVGERLIDDLANLAAFVGVAMAMLPTCFARLQLRENGIWISGGLVKWKRIKSYRWDGQDGLTLLIDYQSRFSPFRQRAIVVPAEHKEKFDEVLREHCAAAE